MHGWVIYNGHLPGDKFLDFAEWIKQAGVRKNVKITIKKNNHLLSLVSTQGSKIINQALEAKPDFVIFGDKDIALARQLEQMDIPVFNSSTSIEICDNKITSYQYLAQEKLPIPKTIIAPKIFPGVKTVDSETFATIETELDYPVVIKEAYGSFGEQVYLVSSREELTLMIEKLKDTPFVIQKFVSSSYGKDIRLNVVGNKVVAAMLRTSNNDFRANVSAGGKMEIYQPSQAEIALAIHATKAVGADFAGVDLLFGPNDKPIICEINSNAHIRNIYDCTNINIADYIVDYVLAMIN
ncbi:ATP-grasp domain-containing protein [Aquibacillus rhizosphaerae]|uniref:RimK family alpha-L-glutamate ligase n=1 Tax=Aquibacillus rhizosphaerae TaxID=3051431 RepID=A0ABT7L8J7_9BACI|nr:RimK family alpha-L-glutamate ligase [Aquibacillus sp. LR5S19]MDL4841684.1 RimK family alpha-L-glutamate ligase [Aquibacillus sp. LR5S19]